MVAADQAAARRKALILAHRIDLALNVTPVRATKNNLLAYRPIIDFARAVDCAARRAARNAARRRMLREALGWCAGMALIGWILYAAGGAAGLAVLL